MMVVQTVVHIGHKCMNWCKLKSSNQVNPDPGFPIGLSKNKEILLEVPNQDRLTENSRPRCLSLSLNQPVIELNIIKFNPDMVNPLISLLTCLVPPLLLCLFFTDQLHYATYQIIFHILFCFYVPFLVCIFNSKLRSFILSHIKK